MAIEAFIAAGHVAHAIEGVLLAIHPDTPLARVRVHVLGGPDNLAVRVAFHVGRGVRYETPGGLSTVLDGFSMWNDLSPEEAPRYLEWLQAGNKGFPVEWRAFAADPAAEWCPEHEHGGVFGKAP